jgi:cytochrome c biogenesis protein CcmG, thiol:disulfide interchange protein DsbE
VVAPLTMPRRREKSILIALLSVALLVSVVIKIEGRGFADGEVRELGSLVVGAPLPLANLTGLSGSRFQISPAHGSPMLVEFGATWCGPCRALLAPMRELQKDFTDAHLEVIAIDVGETADVVQSHYATRDLGGVRVVLDPEGRVAAEWGIQAFPTVVLVDATGMVRLIRVGGSIDRGDLRERVRKVIVP